MTSKPRLFLIDGHSLAYRTYFALTATGDGSRWLTKSGEPTAGTYGFTSVLLRLLEQESPEYLAVSFDTGRTFRDDLFPDYKATRDKAPDDLAPQLGRIRQVVSAFGIPILEAEGFEADDVLGTIARRAAAEGVHTIILTGDRDLLQLADANTTIRLAGQKLSEAVDFGPEEVRQKFGVSPEQLVDYKALVGDTSDNIPGVRGVGEKTALELLHTHGTLDDIYAHLDSVAGRFRSKLDAGRETAYLSRKLAEIVTDIDLDFQLEACRMRGLDRERVTELFRDLEFRSLLDRLPASEQTGPAGRQMALFATPGRPIAELVRTHIVTDSRGLDSLVRRMRDARQISLDVETSDMDALRSDLVGLALADSPEEAFYVPLGHSPHTAGSPQLEAAVALEALRPILHSASIEKVGHNLKFDLLALSRLGLAVGPMVFDTMIAEWLSDPASHNLGLKSLAFVRLGVEMVEIEALIGRGRNQRSMVDVPVAEAAPYASADAAIPLRLRPVLEAELREKNQIELFREMEMPLLPVLADMEMAGVRLDEKSLAELSTEFRSRLAVIEERIHQQVGHSFNINSPQQLAKVLFDELRLAPADRGRKTSSGQPSTAAAILEDLRHVHPVVDLILEQREFAKLQSTYVEALPRQVDPRTRRVHTSYNQTGSVTGRLASYSQIELRIAAHMARDPGMRRAFLADQDIHQATAAAIYAVSPEAVTADMRRHAKAINFGLLYGMSSFGLSRSTGLTLAEAERFVKAYFDRFPGIRGYLDQIRTQARQRGFVETLAGRRRYFPQLEAGSRAVSDVARARAEREAINAPIQGTAADIIKRAMLRLPEALQAEHPGARMLLQVHDELVFEVPLPEVDRAAGRIQDIMRQAYPLDVPLKTDAKVGPNWAEMTPIG